jgi:hypothetical protein
LRFPVPLNRRDEDLLFHCKFPHSSVSLGGSTTVFGVVFGSSSVSLSQYTSFRRN